MSVVGRNPWFYSEFASFMAFCFASKLHWWVWAFLIAAIGIIYLTWYSASHQPPLFSRTPLERGYYVPPKPLPMVHHSDLSSWGGPSLSCCLWRPGAPSTISLSLHSLRAETGELPPCPQDSKETPLYLPDTLVLCKSWLVLAHKSWLLNF